jgi:hypothetical protein
MNGSYTMTPEQRTEWEAGVRSLYADGMVRREPGSSCPGRPSKRPHRGVGVSHLVVRTYAGRVSGLSSGAGDIPAGHRLRECRPPCRRAKRVCEVLSLVYHMLVSEFHDAHRVGGHAVIGDDALAHP